MLTIISFVILLCVIVVIHEFGHLIAAKIFNVYCHEFSIGMGKLLWSKKWKETTYAIRLLPIGGFVAMAGDNENSLETSVDVEVPYERTLNGISKWKKIVIMLAGAFMNFILAWVIVTGIIFSAGSYYLPQEAVVGGVAEGTPAEVAGFEEGDQIISIEFEDGNIIYPETYNDILVYTQTDDGPFLYTVQRDDSLLEIEVTPVFIDEYGVYQVGIMLPEAVEVKTTLISSFNFATDYLISNTKLIFSAFADLFIEANTDNLSGPVGIYQTTSQAVSMGFSTFMLLVALLSLNVGIFNLLPLPILDGGRVAITFFELILGKKINSRLESAIMVGSMLLLLGLMLMATYQDILRLF
ncbi:MAG: M50 family metallopeptidase [Erysipelotrichaceae bacterium]